jgi:hypothetical protein
MKYSELYFSMESELIAHVIVTINISCAIYNFNIRVVMQKNPIQPDKIETLAIIK